MWLELTIIAEGVIIGGPGTGSVSRAVSRGNPNTTPRYSNTPVDPKLIDDSQLPSKPSSVSISMP